MRSFIRTKASIGAPIGLQEGELRSIILVGKKARAGSNTDFHLDKKKTQCRNPYIGWNWFSVIHFEKLAQHGHLQLVLTNAAYLEMNGVAFVMPIHPGPTPIHLAAATTAQITETNHQYTFNLS
jgi:hypothetical protein